MAAYVPISDTAVVPDTLDESNVIVQILHWIGFQVETSCNHIIADTFKSFKDIKMLTKKGINAMATDWASRPSHKLIAQIYFGTRKVTFLKALTYWVEYFFRVSARPSIDGLTEVQFKQKLERALTRATIQENTKDQTSNAAVYLTPDPLKSERKWKVWEDKFNIYA